MGPGTRAGEGSSGRVGRKDRKEQWKETAGVVGRPRSRVERWLRRCVETSTLILVYH